MGIYIKGMEMPRNCFLCLFHKSIYCEITGICTNSAQGCPLIEIPPHGRLIDADKLRESIKESIDECHKWCDEVEGNEMYARVSQSLGTFVECSLRVKAAPTVIEAEDGE